MHMGEGIGRRLPRKALWLAVCVALAAALAVLGGCGSSKGQGRGSTTATRSGAVAVQHVGGRADRWAYARERFHEMCAGCHTLRSAGAHGRRIDLDRDGGQGPGIRRVILNGEPGMPAWRGVISRRELEEIVAFVSATARRDLGGENGWRWQIKLRDEGERWRPERAG
jgi:hypothetical protein